MIKGFICEKTKKKIAFEECLKCALEKSRCNYIYQMLRGMSVLIRLRTDNTVHVTDLMPCIRKVYLDRFHDIYLRPNDMWVRFRGQLGHMVCEKWKPEEGSIVEKPVSKKFKGVTIVGRPDEVIPARKLIRDYKTTRYVKNANLPYGNHPQQTLMYRALLYPKIEIDTIELIYFDMARCVRWSLKKDKDQNQDRWDADKVNAWMEKQGTKLVKAWKTKVAPERELDDSHWMCKSYCEYRFICKTLAQKTPDGENLGRRKIEEGEK